MVFPDIFGCLSPACHSELSNQVFADVRQRVHPGRCLARREQKIALQTDGPSRGASLTRNRLTKETLKCAQLQPQRLSGAPLRFYAGQGRSPC